MGEFLLPQVCDIRQMAGMLEKMKKTCDGWINLSSPWEIRFLTFFYIG